MIHLWTEQKKDKRKNAVGSVCDFLIPFPHIKGTKAYITFIKNKIKPGRKLQIGRDKGENGKIQKKMKKHDDALVLVKTRFFVSSVAKSGVQKSHIVRFNGRNGQATRGCISLVNFN